jgi:hypothetical protein
MSVGGLIAYKNIKMNNILYNNIISFIGIIAILITIWIVNE